METGTFIEGIGIGLAISFLVLAGLSVLYGLVRFHEFLTGLGSRVRYLETRVESLQTWHDDSTGTPSVVRNTRNTQPPMKG